MPDAPARGAAAAAAGAAAGAAAAAAAAVVRGGGWRARTRCARQRGRALSPTRERDEVRNRVVAASTRTCLASHACRWQCRPRCPSPSSTAAAAMGARSCAATSSPRASSRARCATHADQTHQAAHGHRVPRRRPCARHPAPRGQAGEHARDLSAQRTLLATARAVQIRWCLSCVASTYSSSSSAAKGRRCVGIVVGVVIVLARFALGGARFG